MAEQQFTDEQLALLLQTSRDFAFEQIAQGMPLLPFATCVDAAGDMEFVRFAEPDTDLSPDELLEQTRAELVQAAQKGTLSAAAVVSAVRLDQEEDGTRDAIRVEVEAPGFARHFLALYSLKDEGGKPVVSPHKLVPFDARPEIFSAQK